MKVSISGKDLGKERALIEQALRDKGHEVVENNADLVLFRGYPGSGLAQHDKEARTFLAEAVRDERARVIFWAGSFGDKGILRELFRDFGARDVIEVCFATLPQVVAYLEEINL